jgi:hypothetical protein
MQERRSNVGDTRFVLLVSWALMALLGTAIAFSIKAEFDNLQGISQINKPGAISAENMHQVEITTHVVQLVAIALFSFLFFAVFSFGRMRNWARKVIVSLMYLIVCQFIFVGGAALLQLGGMVSGMFNPDDDKSQTNISIAISILMVVAFAIAYGCLRVIRKLQSQGVKQQFG